MYCTGCGYILQRNYDRSNPLAWVICDDELKCKKCYPNLHSLWLEYKYSKNK